MAFLGTCVQKVVGVTKSFVQRGNGNASTTVSKQFILAIRNTTSVLLNKLQISNFSQRRLISSSHETHITNKTTTTSHHGGHDNHHHGDHGHGSGEIPSGHYENFFQEHGQFKGRHVTRRYYQYMVHRSTIALVACMFGSFIFYIGLSKETDWDVVKREQKNSQFGKDLDEIDERIKARNRVERERVKYYQENFKMYNIPEEHGHH